MRTWRLCRFDDLSAREAHDIFRARIEVFVLEQGCPFQDLDGLDPQCWHLVGRSGGEIDAYCRIVPPGAKFDEPALGRVLTVKRVRGTGAGRDLMREALERMDALFPGRAIRLCAQAHLERFYGEFGFAKASEPYLEDGIPHIDMLRAAGRGREQA